VFPVSLHRIKDAPVHGLEPVAQVGIARETITLMA
jgi:hypothetical protein